MSEPIIIDLDRPTVPITSYSDVFWSRWLREQHRIEYAIRMVCIRMRYYGCIEDIVSETLLRCQTKWPGFIGDNFVNWVSWEAKAYLTGIYRSQPMCLSLQEPLKDPARTTSGGLVMTIEDTIADESVLPVEDQVLNMAQLQELALLHRGTMAGRVLESMAALADNGFKLSLRNIALAAGISHTQVRTELKKIRASLQINGDML